MAKLKEFQSNKNEECGWSWHGLHFHPPSFAVARCSDQDLNNKFRGFYSLAQHINDRSKRFLFDSIIKFTRNSSSSAKRTSINESQRHERQVALTSTELSYDEILDKVNETGRVGWWHKTTQSIQKSGCYCGCSHRIFLCSQKIVFAWSFPSIKFYFNEKNGSMSILPIDRGW